MWRDWPRPIQPGTTQNNFLAPLLIDGEGWCPDAPIQIEGEEFGAFYPDSSLCVYSEFKSNCLTQYCYDIQTKKIFNGQRFYWLHNYNNALTSVYAIAFDGDGNLWAVTDIGLQVCDQNGRVRAILDLPNLTLDFNPFSISAKIYIHDGSITIADCHAAFTRKLNVKAPIPGVRPKSQGQG